MGNDTSPGGIARIHCSRCGEIVFFTCKGGPSLLPCPHCGHAIRLELVHDGKKWRIKDLQAAEPR